VLAGVLLGVAFLPLPLAFLAWFAFVPLLDVLDARLRARAPLRSLFATGYAFGLAFFGIGTYWIAMLSNVAITVPWLKYPAWIAAAAYLALFSGLATAAAGWLSRHAALRSRSIAFCRQVRVGELEFPWFQPGYAGGLRAADADGSLGSVTLVTAWLLLLNTLLWRSITARSRLRTVVGAVLALLLPWFWGQRAIDAAPREAGAQVALVQGNIPGEIKWSGHHETEILATFLRLSQEAAARDPKPVLIVWPETATGTYLRKDLEQSLQVSNFVARAHVPVFSGFADYDLPAAGAPRAYNAAGLYGLDLVPGERYAKRHLVPFGERMPFERLIPALGRLALGQAEWTPGDHPVLFPSSAGLFSCLICFESIFPDLARGDVRRGARWIVNVTNDEWFGNSAALYQHAAMAQFRAVENHVPIARCANTGLTTDRRERTRPGPAAGVQRGCR
jgi:apolipoprotein N-acyltransferase